MKKRKKKTLTNDFLGLHKNMNCAFPLKYMEKEELEGKSPPVGKIGSKSTLNALKKKARLLKRVLTVVSRSHFADRAHLP